MITKGPLSGKTPKILYLTPKDLNNIYDNLLAILYEYFGTKIIKIIAGGPIIINIMKVLK